MRDARFDRRQALVLLGATFGLPQFASAQQGWPTRSVRYVLGFAAGGPTDTLSRVFCQKMSSLTGQQFVVENRVGAGGVIANDAVAKSPPDGYTVGMGGQQRDRDRHLCEITLQGGR